MNASESALTREELERRRLAAAQDLLSGCSQARVARTYGVSRTTTSRWYYALQRMGVESLRSRRATGRPRRLNSQQYQELVSMYREGALLHGFQSNEWTNVRLAAAIQARFGVRYDPDHVSKIVKHLGLRRKSENFYAASLYSPNTVLSAPEISPTVA